MNCKWSCPLEQLTAVQLIYYYPKIFITNKIVIGENALILKYKRHGRCCQELTTYHSITN